MQRPSRLPQSALSVREDAAAETCPSKAHGEDSRGLFPQSQAENRLDVKKFLTPKADRLPMEAEPARERRAAGQNRHRQSGQNTDCK